MCRPASMMVSINDIYIGPSDSHEAIKKLHKLVDNFPIKYVPIEIYPDDFDFTRDPKDWKLHTDLLKSDWPSWYSEQEAEIACRDRIPSWIAGIVLLDCSHMYIKELPVMPNLRELYCSGTSIKELPLMPKLERLYCSDTPIKELLVMPSLKTLYCSGTPIKELLVFPNLEKLDCHNTPIKELPVMPKLKTLYRYGTFIKELPIMANLDCI